VKRGAPAVTKFDELSLGRESRERFQALLTSVRDCDTERELMAYIERFFTMQNEVRQYFSLVEREIAEKLREFRAIDESERAAVEHLHEVVDGSKQGEGQR